MRKRSSFLKDQSGATAVEYALVAVIIAVGILVSVEGVGTNLSHTITTIAKEIESAN